MLYKQVLLENVGGCKRRSFSGCHGNALCVVAHFMFKDYKLVKSVFCILKFKFSYINYSYAIIEIDTLKYTIYFF